jgi:hypothetical protein
MRRASRRGKGSVTPPMPDHMGPSAQYVAQATQDMAFLDEQPEWLILLVHEYGAKAAVDAARQFVTPAATKVALEEQRRLRSPLYRGINTPR